MEASGANPQGHVFNEWCMSLDSSTATRTSMSDAYDEMEQTPQGSVGAPTPPKLGTIHERAGRRLGPLDDIELSQRLENYAKHKNGHDGRQSLDDADAKPRLCGAIPRSRPSSAEVSRRFATILQVSIERCLTEERSLFVRIFEDYSFSFKLPDGDDATFIECRGKQFRKLREISGTSKESFLDSICGGPLKGGKEASGKSGALFLRTHDNKYLLKTIEEHEFDVLRDILPNYVLYLEDNPASLLCRFYGAYSLKISGHTLRVAVMENVLRKLTKGMEIYDLKGTTEDRWVDPSVHSVLKDQNFGAAAMCFDAVTCRRLQQTIQYDAEFLETLGIMDYSLLVGVTIGAGVDAAPTRTSRSGMILRQAESTPIDCHFQYSIIDYLQRWTPKKVLAHWLKKPTLGCFHEIDTEPPTIYAARFFKYFERKIVHHPLAERA